MKCSLIKQWLSYKIAPDLEIMLKIACKIMILYVARIFKIWQNEIEEQYSGFVFASNTASILLRKALIWSLNFQMASVISNILFHAICVFTVPLSLAAGSKLMSSSLSCDHINLSPWASTSFCVISFHSCNSNRSHGKCNGNWCLGKRGSFVTIHYVNSAMIN